jgi:hypothetical protein
LKALKKWKDERKSFKNLRGFLRETGRIVASEIEVLFDNQDSYLASVEKIEADFREKIQELANSHSLLDPNKDPILDKVLLLFDGKVGDPYDITALQKLYKEGEERYSREQPPGFMDAKEKNNERKYGDFILWKQILDFAKAESCSIIFVTGEKKEDWWIRKNGRIVFP